MHIDFFPLIERAVKHYLKRLEGFRSEHFPDEGDVCKVYLKTEIEAVELIVKITQETIQEYPRIILDALSCYIFDLEITQKHLKEELGVLPPSDNVDLELSDAYKIKAKMKKTIEDLPRTRKML